MEYELQTTRINANTSPPTFEVWNGVDWAPVSTTASLAGLFASKLSATTAATTYVPQTVLAPGPAPSGDITGATDTGAINTLLAQGVVVVLPAGHYYINATLNLAGNNGISMPPNSQTTLEWVGAAGGSVISTPAFTSPSQAAFWGVVEGGQVLYPYAKITAATKVIYLAQPNPARPLTTTIYTDFADVTTHTPVTGSAGYVLDGNSNPGPFQISARIIGQFDYQIWARTSHVVALGCQGAYGNDLIVFDNDSLNSSIPPCNCSVIGCHTFLNQRSVVRLRYAYEVNVVSGMYETAASGSPGEFLYCDTTFSGFATLQGPYQFNNGAGYRMAHYGTGRVRFVNVQDNWEGIFIGNSTTGVPTISLTKPQQTITSARTNYGTTSTTTARVGVSINQSVASSVGRGFRIRFIGQANNNTASDGYVVQLIQTSVTAVGNDVTGTPSVLDSVTVAAVRAASQYESVALEYLLTGQNTAGTSFAVAVKAVTGGTATVQGIMTVEVL